MWFGTGSIFKTADSKGIETTGIEKVFEISEPNKFSVRIQRFYRYHSVLMSRRFPHCIL